MLNNPDILRERVSLGVDGCRGGWLVIALSEQGGSFGLYPSLRGLLSELVAKTPVFIDMPLGLIEDSSMERACESLVRQRLGPRRSSVFAVPPRQVLALSNYDDANAKSRELTGKGLSQQAFGLLPRVLELDRLLEQSAKARGIFRESHPELCFWALAGKQPMQHPKKTQAGFEERLATLSRYWSEAETLAGQAMLHLAGSGVARDDILDAFANALNADAGKARWRTLPSKPIKDPRGLPMRITYADFSA